MAEHYKLLADEVEADMAAGLFPVPSEKYRLLGVCCYGLNLRI